MQLCCCYMRCNENICKCILLCLYNQQLQWKLRSTLHLLPPSGTWNINPPDLNLLFIVVVPAWTEPGFTGSGSSSGLSSMILLIIHSLSGLFFYSFLHPGKNIFSSENSGKIQTSYSYFRVKLQQRVRFYSLERSSPLLDIEHRT